MNVDELMAQARDNMTVKRVFGEPIVRDGVTVIPVASVAGGMGGGSGSGGKGDEEQGEGSGFGFGMRARPAGVYVIRDGEVDWEPAVNVNRIVAGGQLLGLVLLVIVWALLRSRGKTPHLLAAPTE